MASLTTAFVSEVTWGVQALGPLTAFTPPTPCLSHLYYNATSHTPIDNVLYANPELAWSTMASCFPSGAHAVESSALSIASVYRFGGYYSPGVCPGGYTSACTEHRNLATVQTQSAAICCPSGYSCWFGDMTDYPAVSCLQIPTATTTVTAVEGEGTAVVPTEINSIPNTIFATAIRIRWESGDVVTPTATETVVRNTVSADSSTDTAGTGGSPAWVKIVIKVALPLVVLAILVGLVVFFLRRQRALRAAMRVPQRNVEVKTGYELGVRDGAVEMGGGEARGAELSGGDSRPGAAEVQG